MTGGYDLGIFEQAVRAYAHLRAPVAELKAEGFNLLGDHFHPAVALVAPLYRLFPSPVTLLVVQAALLAVSAVPVSRLAADLLGRRAGWCAGLAYGLSWGVQQAAWFDFHEIAFAVPLLAFAATGLARKRWRAAAAWSLPLLLVKEDQALTVAAIGAYVFFAGNRRIGAALSAGAVAAGVLTVHVIIPAFNPRRRYTYSDYAGLEASNPVEQFLAPVDVKGWTLFMVLAPTLFLALRSPLVLLAAPCLVARFWANVPFYWGTGFHYSAVLMPIVFVAALDGLRRLRAPGAERPRPRGEWPRILPQAMLAAAVAISLLQRQPLTRLLSPAAWHAPPRFQAATATLRAVPDGADVAASNHLAPRLTGRCRVFQLYVAGPPRPRTEWVAAITRAGPFPAQPDYDTWLVPRLPGLGYQIVARGGGVTVYRRPGTGTVPPPAATR